MGPQNAIVGDDSFGTNLPETTPPELDLTVEKNMAKFSKSKEFQRLKEVMEGRIEFHKQYMPGGQPGTQIPFRDLPNEERGWRTLAADMVIEELRGIIGAYAEAENIVKEAAAAENARRSVS